MKKEISVELLQEIANYLQQRPLGETYAIFNKLIEETKEQPKPEEEEKKEE